MKWIPMILVLLASAMGGVQCSKTAAANALGVGVTPSQPVFIPYGTKAVSVGPGGYFQLTPPYFSAAGITLTWSGTNTLEILAITVTTLDANAKIAVQCSLGGLDISVIFPGFNDPVTGNVKIPAGNTASSASWGCGGITVPSPIPNSFNIPVNVKVVGIELDGSGNPIGRVSSSTNITLQ